MRGIMSRGSAAQNRKIALSHCTATNTAASLSITNESLIAGAVCMSLLATRPANLLEAVQQRLDGNPQAMRLRRETVEHPFGTLKMRMGATHFLMRRLPKVATEMALHVLAYNLPRVMVEWKPERLQRVRPRVKRLTRAHEATPW